MVPDNVSLRPVEDFLKKLNTEHRSTSETSEDEDLSHNEDWQLVEKTLLKYLLEDPEFEELFKRFSYQGSTYENLKVGPHDEFDINLELKLGYYYELEVSVEGTNPGFATVKVGSIKKQPIAAVKKTVENWLNEEGYIYTNKILDWFKGVVDDALTLMEKNNAIPGIQITRRESGPAITLYIDYHTKFSIDLVLALPFATSEMPVKQRAILQRVIENMGCDSAYMESQVWYLIPKKPLCYTAPEWRMSFYLYEKKIMKGLQGMKFVLKILKILRDQKKWKPLSSYYIKTVFLWQLEENESLFWSIKSRAYLFYHMLEKLVSYLQNEAIEYFWDENCNLIQTFDKDFVVNVTQYILIRLKRLEAALKGQGHRTPEEVLYDMFSVEYTSSTEVKAQSNENGFGDMLFEGLAGAFNKMMLPGDNYRHPTAGPVQQSMQPRGLFGFFAEFASQIKNTFTPWKRQGIEENEGLIEGLKNGSSQPKNEQARKRQGGSWKWWLLVVGAMVTAAALAANAPAPPPPTTTTTTTTTNTTTTNSTTTSTYMRRF